jgi:hypothetical protein
MQFALCILGCGNVRAYSRSESVRPSNSCCKWSLEVRAKGYGYPDVNAPPTLGVSLLDKPGLQQRPLLPGIPGKTCWHRALASAHEMG